MVGPHLSGIPYTKLGASSDSSAPSEQHVTSDSSSDDDSELQIIPIQHIKTLLHTFVCFSALLKCPEKRHLLCLTFDSLLGDPSSNIQEESTTDIPLPRFARYRKNAVYENCAGGVGVLRPSPEGSGFGV